MTVGIDLPWTKMISPEVKDLGEGTLVLSQMPEAIHRNHNGDMHAGVIFAMSEMAGMGVVVLLLGEYANGSLVVVKNVNIGFTARAQGAITFSAKLDEAQQARILEAAASGQTIEEEVNVQAVDSEGEQVAASVVTAFIRQKADR